jgi:protein gp37
MATNSTIEWTDTTWNPLTGCTKISPGCRNCYAERMSKRLQAMGQVNYANGFRLTLHEEMIEQPLSWRKPRRVFVNSMSDLFHNDVPDEFICMGVSVENADYQFRIDHLRQTGAAVKFLSIEPLLGPLPNLNLKGIDWVIVGGESGPGARAVAPEWVIEIRNQCVDADVAFFFKQWGGTNKKRTGRELEGRTWNEMPQDDGEESANRIELELV